MDKKSGKNDIILIVGILIAACVLFLGMKVYQSKTTKDGVAVVTVDGTVRGEYSLRVDREKKIELKDGSYNMLVIKDGKANVTDASCRDQICANHKEISKNGESIVCLPNKVVITIENGDGLEVDSTTN